MERIHEIESEVKHDVIAFTTAVAETMAARGHGDVSRWFHYGLTSNDVVDTAQALLLQQASAILLRDLEQLRDAAEAARAGVPAHGADRPHARRACRADHVRAEARDLARRGEAQSDPAAARPPRTCGSARPRARSARSAHIDPETEELICERLNLKPAAVASQVIQRDRHAQFRVGAGAGDGAVREDRAGSAASAAHRSARGRGVFRARARRAVRRCPTSAIR